MATTQIKSEDIKLLVNAEELYNKELFELDEAKRKTDIEEENEALSTTIKLAEVFSTIEKTMKIPKEMVYKYECFSKVDQQYEIHCLVKNKC